MSNWDDFAAFVRSVDDARQSLGIRPHQECFFRGHSDGSYKLLPSLFRQGVKTAKDYWQLERRAFFEFRTRARQLYNADHSDWDVLFHMQHHGVPTRLLDWTSVFGVALYFALLRHDTHSDVRPCIWVLNPYALNHATWNYFRLFTPKYLARDEERNRSYDYSEILLDTWKIGWETPLAIYPQQHSDRMFAQSGWFTIHGTNLAPMEEIFSGRGDILQKIEVPHSAISEARKFLNFAGIDHRQLFPDLDGLARSVCDRFGMGQRNVRG